MMSKSDEDLLHAHTATLLRLHEEELLVPMLLEAGMLTKDGE